MVRICSNVIHVFRIYCHNEVSSYFFPFLFHFCYCSVELDIGVDCFTRVSSEFRFNADIEKLIRRAREKTVRRLRGKKKKDGNKSYKVRIQLSKLFTILCIFKVRDATRDIQIQYTQHLIYNLFVYI